mgnify:CR=1 FL=1
MTRKEKYNFPQLDDMVFHEKIYNGKELMKIVGIRKTEVELEGDYSGGTHNVSQKSWLPIEGLFRLRKVCIEHQRSGVGSCQLPNVHCGFPDCEPFVTKEEI